MKGNFAEFLILKRHIDMEVIAAEIKELWCKACYLIINWHIDELKEFGRWQVPTEVYTEVAEHLYAYVYEDQMPPEPIRQTILNVADDFVRGEPVRFRAGDYIALQGYIRARG